MFIHNLNPTLFSIGPFTVRFYGIVYALGFLFVYFYMLWAAKNNKIKNLKEKDVDWLVILSILGVIIGARAGEVLYHISYYIKNPADILKVWQGGLAFHGAFIGFVIVLWLFTRKKKINMLEVLDHLSIPVAALLFFGRIANFVNGELYGTVTNVPWCVNFRNTGAGDLCRHPSQLYEALKNLALFFILFFTSKNKKERKPGFLFWLFLTLYGAFRFVVTIWRDDKLILGLSGGQWLSLAMVILGGIMLYRMKKQKEYKEKDTNKK